MPMSVMMDSIHREQQTSLTDYCIFLCPFYNVQTVSIVKNSSGDTIIHTAGSSLEEKKSFSSDSQVIKEEIGGHSSTPSRKDEFLDCTLKTQAKKRSSRNCQGTGGSSFYYFYLCTYFMYNN